MPKPCRKPPAAIPPPKPRSSSADFAKAALARRAEPVLGKPDMLKLTMTLYLRRAVAERLTARAIEKSRRLEDLVREVLEQAAQ